jgi:hypothetical protein
MPHGLRTWGTTWLARHDNVEPASPQVIGKNADLRGFPSALAALEADEQSSFFGRCIFRQCLFLISEMTQYRV